MNEARQPRRRVRAGGVPVSQVRLLAGLVLALVAAQLLGGGVRAEGETVSIDSLGQAIGESGSVTLSARNMSIPPLGAWQIDIEYDPAILSPSDCESPVSGVICNLTYEPNKVRIVGVDINGLQGATIALATLDFACLTSGASDIIPRVERFADTNGFEIPRLVQPGVIDCSGTGLVSTPTAFHPETQIGTDDQPANLSSERGASPWLIALIIVAFAGVVVAAIWYWRSPRRRET